VRVDWSRLELGQEPQGRDQLTTEGSGTIRALKASRYEANGSWAGRAIA
jgi:hypothetical protein